MSKPAIFVRGKVCEKHPELDGQRYEGGGCVACVKLRRTNNRKDAAARMRQKAPLRDGITEKIADEVYAERRVMIKEWLREEKRRQILREEYGRVRR